MIKTVISWATDLIIWPPTHPRDDEVGEARRPDVIAEIRAVRVRRPHAPHEGVVRVAGVGDIPHLQRAAVERLGERGWKVRQLCNAE